MGYVSNIQRGNPNDRFARIEKMIQELCDLEDGLTQWEVEFVDSVSKQEVRSLSARQIETVEKIHEKRV